jgi:hypothetical protein
MDVCGCNSADGPDTDILAGFVVEPELQNIIPGVGRPLNCVEGCSRLGPASVEFWITPAFCPLISAICVRFGSGHHRTWTQDQLRLPAAEIFDSEAAAAVGAAST